MTVLGRIPNFALATALSGAGAYFLSTKIDRRRLGCHPIKVVMVMLAMVPDETAFLRVSNYCKGPSM